MINITINQRGWRFKALIFDYLPPNITHISFGLWFNQSLAYLPSKITHFALLNCYDMDIPKLPASITHIYFDTPDSNIKEILSQLQHLTHINYHARHEPILDILDENYNLILTDIDTSKMKKHTENNIYNQKMKSINLSSFGIDLLFNTHADNNIHSNDDVIYKNCSREDHMDYNFYDGNKRYFNFWFCKGYHPAGRTHLY